MSTAAAKTDPIAEILSRYEVVGECHLWTGGTNGNGYGQVRVGGEQVLVHRLAFEYGGGDVSGTVRHIQECGNKLCIRFTHLESSWR